MSSRPKRSLPTTRQSLLNRLKDWEDQAGWRDFFETYWGVIYGTARRAGLSDAEAQDVVQETILHLARELKAFRYDRTKGSFRAYLFNAVRWKVQDQFKKRGRMEAHDPAQKEIETGTSRMARMADPAGNEFEHLWEEEWVVNIETVAWDRLKRRVRPEHFQIFEALIREGWEAARVAKEFGVSRATVYVLKLRVGKIFAAELNRLRKARL